MKRWRFSRLLRTVLIALCGIFLCALLAGAAHPPFNVLILGVDGDGGTGQRSDTIVLLSANPRLGRLSLISIPRDTLLTIPDYGPDKAGHAFAYGGAALTQASVSGLLGVPVDRVVVVSLSSFIQLVDLLGGVEVDVEKEMYYYDPYQNLAIELEPGRQRLTGDQAMQFVRYRSDGGDITRIGRQQQFLQAVAAEARRPANIVKWPALITAGLAAVDTDLNVFDLAALLQISLRLQPTSIAATTLPGGAGTGSNGLWYWFPDDAALPAIVADTIYNR